MKPLKPHAFEMLRLIGANTTASRYWCPQNRTQMAEDAGGVFAVVVGGAQTVGAITTLTTRGYCEIIQGGAGSGAGKYARRITATGRALLDEHIAPLIAARKKEQGRRLALTQAEREAEDCSS